MKKQTKIMPHLKQEVRVTKQVKCLGIKFAKKYYLCEASKYDLVFLFLFFYLHCFLESSFLQQSIKSVGER